VATVPDLADGRPSLRDDRSCPQRRPRSCKTTQDQPVCAERNVPQMSKIDST
jgi:hypothetical protein